MYVSVYYFRKIIEKQFGIDSPKHSATNGKSDLKIQRENTKKKDLKISSQDDIPKSIVSSLYWFLGATVINSFPEGLDEKLSKC